MRAWIVADLGFGDAGKGTITDFLVRETGARVVVRWNGGAQAGHTVVTDGGRAHTFAQLGAGTFVPGVRTHLAEPVVVHPTALLVELRHLARVGVRDALERLTVAESARLITPFHQAANRAREAARDAGRHGSCGVGFGEAVRESLELPRDEAARAADLRTPGRLRDQAEHARRRLWGSLSEERESLGEGHPELAPFLDDALSARWVDAVAPLGQNVVADERLGAMLREGDVVLEGAQGVLLDESFGFHPHTTWSDCTPRAAAALLAAHHHTGTVTRLGVLRTYLTRHGHGPFPTEERALAPTLPEPHNADTSFQGAFRVGHADLVLARYAARVSGGIDALAVTHLDRAPAMTRVALSYEGAGDPSLFVHDAAGRAIDLRAGDLDHQARLARALAEVSPVLERAGAPIEELLASTLGAELAILSEGPRPSDKRWLRKPPG